MELLAPAGSYAAAVAAVNNGADAVYIGGSKFSARRSAKNFTDEEIKRISDYCRVRGVSLHVAANISVKDKEKNEFIEYVGYLNDVGIDALIIQDIGMAAKIRKFFPDLPLHASTQMTAASLDAVRFLENAGFSRVVLSRELPKNEIESICKSSRAEIEVFVHGALCMCYSGQCLLSSIIGGRSGNRGMCAQPCRLPYELIDGKKCVNSGYLLSPKDLALLDELSVLEKIGVKSLKIEGRLKKPEYTAAVTGVYSRLLKSGERPAKKDWDILTDAFNRSGFTKGYFENKKGISMMSISNPGNAAENKIHPNTNEKKISVSIFAEIKKNEYPRVSLSDGEYNFATAVSDKKAEKAERRPLEKERIKEQLSKLGATPFEAEKIEIDLGDDTTMPIAELNALRRKAVEMLENKRCERDTYRNLTGTYEEEKCEEKRLAGRIFSAKVKTREQAIACINGGIKRIYAPEEVAAEIKERDVEVITVLPPVWRNKDVKDFFVKDGVLVSNLGEAERFKEFCLYGDTRLNIFNSESVAFFKNFKSVAVSNELNLKEINRLKAFAPLEAVIYGRTALMVTENCPARANGACGKNVSLKDRKNEKFPLSCAPGCYSELLNSKPLYMADKLEDLERSPVDIYRFEFTIENAVECEKILKAYKKCAAPEGDFTRGHYYRGAE